MNYLLGKQIKQYQIEALLGEGGMGVVYRAYDLNHDRFVALKVLHDHLSLQDNYRRHFLQEAEATANLDHPGIVKTLDYGHEGNLVFMAMEELKGGTLKEYIAQMRWGGRAVDVADALDVAGQIAEGLQYAHHKGIVHRDVKPSNILIAVDANGKKRVALADFGVATITNDASSDETGPFHGSLSYMSPEQYMGAPLDGRSDLYSLGVTLYEMLTGQLPFAFKSAANSAHQHINETPPLPSTLNSQIPPTVDGAVMRALAKKPEDRPGNGSLMAEEFYQIMPQAMVGGMAASAESNNSYAPQLAYQTPESVTQLENPALVARVDMASRVDFNSTWTQGAFRLFVIHQWERARIVSLDDNVISLGRSTKNQIVINDPTISRHHIQLERVGDGWQVIDLGGTNGTFLEGVALEPHMPEPWLGHQILRVGTYFLQWQPFAKRPAQQAPALPVSSESRPASGVIAAAGVVAAGVVAGAVMEGDEGEGTAEFMEAAVAFSNTDLIEIVGLPTQIQLTPGDENSFNVTVLNHGNAIEDATPSIVGLNQEWISFSDTELKLMPGDQHDVEVTINLPLDSQSTAGTHDMHFVIETQSQLRVDKAAEAIIEPFLSSDYDLHPQEIRERERTRLTVTNTGNQPVVYEISPSNNTDSVQFLFEKPNNVLDYDYKKDEIKKYITVAAGESANVEFYARPKRQWNRLPRRAIFVRTVRYPFIVELVTDDGEAETDSALDAEVAFAPLIGWLPLFLLLFLLCFGGSAAGYAVFTAQQALASANAELNTVQQESAAAQMEANVVGNRATEDAVAALATIQAAGSDEERASLAAQATADAAVSQATVVAAEAAASNAASAAATAAAARDEIVADNNNTNNDPPTNITLSTESVAENNTVNASIASISAEDPNLLDTNITFSLVSGTGGTNNDLFVIDGDQLIALNSFDFETKASYEILIEANDGNGGTYQEAFVIAVTNVDDDPVITVSNMSVDESTGTASVTVSLTGNSGQDISVNYITGDSGAKAGTDYSATNGSLVWEAGDTADKTISITIADDAFDETDETFNVAFSDASNAKLSADTLVVTITDNDGQPSISIADITVGENDSTATVTAVLSGTSGTDVTVAYATSDNTAAAGKDYTAASGTLTWAAGETGNQTFTISLTDDAVDESTEVIDVTLSKVTNATLSDATSTVSITDADSSPTITIADMTIGENNTSVDMTVTLAGSSSSVVTVDYAASAVTASSTDFTDGSSGTVTWAAEETGAKTFSISLSNDTIFEGDETFSVALDKAVNAIISTGTAVVTITDDDSIPAVSVADVSASESAGTIDVVVALSGASATNVTVSYVSSIDSSLGTSGASSADFTTVSGSLTWTAGDTGNKTVTIPLTSDNIDELDESFNFTLSNPTPSTSLQFANTGDETAKITITDDDAAPVLALASTAVTVTESAGPATINVSITGESSQVVTVDCVTANSGSTPAATSGSDYTALAAGSQTLTWAAGDTAAKSCSVVLATNDGNEPDSETFALNLSSAANATLDAANDNATVTISDSDAAPQISVSDFSLTEGDTGTNQSASFNVTLSSASESNVTVAYTVTAGTATVTDDYLISPVNGTVSFAAGETSKTVVVTVVGDDVFEADETVLIAIGGATDDIVGTTDVATILDASGTGTITNNDAAPNISVAVSSGNPFTETTGGVAVFEVSIDRLSSVTTTVQYDTASGTATSGTDFTALTAQTLTWGPNTNDTKLISVTITADNIYENPDETLSLGLSNQTGGAVISVNSATATIDDDDSVPVVTLVSTSGTVAESALTASIVLSISNPSGAAITVNYTTTNGTALSGSDYTAVSGGSVTFPADDGTTQTASVAIAADGLDDTAEMDTFTAQFAGTNFSGSDTFTVTITDDDADPIVTISDLTVTEGDSGSITGTMTVTMTGGSEQSIIVDYATADNSAMITNSDYNQITGQSFTWTTGTNGTRTFDVTVNGDVVAEADETFSVNVTANGSSGDVTITGSPGVITIPNDDVPGVTVGAVASTSISETVVGNSTTFTAVLNTEPTHDVTFTVTPNAQCIASSSVLTFTSGTWNIDQTVTITATDESVDDEGESCAITLGNTASTDGLYSGLAVSDPSVLVDNDDTAGILFSAADATAIDEPTGTTTSTVFTVTLTSEPTADTTVNLAENDSSECSVTTSVLLTAANWNTGVPATITSAADSMVDGLQTCTISISSVTGSDTDYTGLSTAGITRAVNVTDVDTASIVVAYPSITAFNEISGSYSMTVTLTSIPTGDVTVPLSTSDPSECSTADASLILNSTNWNTGAVTTINIENDAVADGIQPCTVQTDDPTAVSDTTYNLIAASGVADFSLTVADDDTAGITVSAVSAATMPESGGSVTFTVVLDSEPAGNVTIPVTGTSNECTVNGATTVNLPFTTGNWNMTRTVTIAAIDDDVDTTDTICNVTLGNSSNGVDTVYDAIDPDDRSVTIADDDTAGITVSAISAATMPESGGSVTFTVVLDSEPTGNVTIPVTGTSNECTVNGLTTVNLPFTAGNWNMAQTVTVAAIDDNTDTADTTCNITLSNSSNGADTVYDAINPDDRSVTITDDETSTITVTSPIVTSYGESSGSTTFTVTLSSEPVGTVTIPLSSSDTGVCTVPASVAVTSANWTTGAVVTITILNDTIADGSQTCDITTAILRLPSDAGYNALGATDVADVTSLTITDDDTAAITVVTTTVSCQ